MADVFDRHGVRFDPRLAGCSTFVRHSDYAVLEERLAELAAENERLTSRVETQVKLYRQALARAKRAETKLAEALSRTGAVKALEWTEYETDGWADRADAEAGSFGVFYNIDIQKDGYRVVFDHEAVGAIGTFDTADEAKAAAQADFERRILSSLVSHTRDANTVVSHEAANMRDKPAALEAAPPAPKVRELLCDFEDFINEPPPYEDQRMVRDYRHELYRKWGPLCMAVLSVLEPAAPEGQQPVAWQRRNMYPDAPGAVPQWTQCSASEATDQFKRKPGCEYRPLYTRPSEQAVTEAMVEALKEARSVIYDTQQACLFDDDDGQIGVTEDAVISPHHFQKLCRALGAVDNALKAAMEAAG